MAAAESSFPLPYLVNKAIIDQCDRPTLTKLRALDRNFCRMVTPKLFGTVKVDPCHLKKLLLLAVSPFSLINSCVTRLTVSYLGRWIPLPLRPPSEKFLPALQKILTPTSYLHKNAITTLAEHPSLREVMLVNDLHFWISLTFIVRGMQRSKSIQALQLVAATKNNWHSMQAVTLDPSLPQPFKLVITFDAKKEYLNL